MWLAHALTVVRLPLAALFWAVADRPAWALATLLVAGLSDVADGRVARHYGAREGTRLGAWLDPLCDKLFVLAVLVAMATRVGTPIPWLLAVAAREVVLLPLSAIVRVAASVGALRSRVRYEFRAEPVGKATTVVQFLALGGLLLRHPTGPVLAVVAGALGLVAAGHYVVRGVRLLWPAEAA